MNGHSQKARDIMLLGRSIGFLFSLLIFWVFVFVTFTDHTLDLKDPTTVGLLTTTINQGFNLAMIAAGYVYFRDQAQAPRQIRQTDIPPGPLTDNAGGPGRS